MRNYPLLLLFTSILLFSSCRTSEKVTSTKAYKKAISEIQSELSVEGYQMYDKQNSADIDGSKQDIYKFRDTTGNTMEFKVMYYVKNDDDVYYVENVQVDGCSTSDNKAYESLCGNESPIYKVEHLKKDEKISRVSAGKTIFFLVGLPFIIVGALFGIVYGGLAIVE